jgi:hypothetical protein
METDVQTNRDWLIPYFYFNNDESEYKTAALAEDSVPRRAYESLECRLRELEERHLATFESLMTIVRGFQTPTNQPLEQLN